MMAVVSSDEKQDFTYLRNEFELSVRRMSKSIFKVRQCDMYSLSRRWLWILDKLALIAMIEEQNFDIRTITMGISLLDCIDPDIERAAEFTKNHH